MVALVWRFHWVLTTDDRMDLFRFFCEGLIKNSLSSRVNWNPDRWKWVWEWKLRQFWKTGWNLEEEGVWGLFLNMTAMSQKFCYIYNRVQLRQENNKVKSRTIYNEKKVGKNHLGHFCVFPFPPNSKFKGKSSKWNSDISKFNFLCFLK